jgi:glycosyltransferase involved in cell wall biosynthesis
MNELDSNAEALQPGVVSVVVPTLNSARTLRACLASVRNQDHEAVELIVVDGGSRDETRSIADTLANHVFSAGPDQAQRRVFGAPYQRNFGAARAAGEYVYYLDADMVMPPTLLSEAVASMEEHEADALIIAEVSFGTGFWAGVKALERSCYLGDDRVEAPRLVRTSVWRSMGGLDEWIGGGGDDWDLHIRLRRSGARIERLGTGVLHDEGHLSLRALSRKRFLYGQNIGRFIATHGLGTAAAHFNPLRPGFARNWRTLAGHPIYLGGLVAMRTVEYSAGGAGLALATWRRSRKGVPA